MIEELHIEYDGTLWPVDATSPENKLEITGEPLRVEKDGRVLYNETGCGQVGSPYLTMHNSTHEIKPSTRKPFTKPKNMLGYREHL